MYILKSRHSKYPLHQLDKVMTNFSGVSPVMDAKLNSKPKNTLLEPNAYVVISNTIVVDKSLPLETRQQLLLVSVQLDTSLNSRSTERRG